jgi:hypothetical protein
VEAPGVLSLVVLMFSVVGVFVFIPFVSQYAFWVAVGAFVFLYWATAKGANFFGIVSLVVLMLAIAAVFCEIPFVSNFAYWFVIAAYLIRLRVMIPRVTPDRIGLYSVGN